MTSEQALYLVPYFISAAISFGILAYSWRHRQVKGAFSYSIYMGFQFLSLVGFIFELITPNLEIKLLWDKFQWFTDGMFIILAFLAFALQFTDIKLQRPKLFWGILSGIPIFFNILVITDPIHHLIYPNPYLTDAKPFSELKYDYTITVYLFVLYIYASTIYGFTTLITKAIKKQNRERWQIVTIATGFLIPFIFSIFSLLDISLTPQRDATPFTFAFGNLIVAWGLFRFGTFEIVPIAREQVIENLLDPVFVIDPDNRIIDANSSAFKFLGRDSNAVIGWKSGQICDQWPELAELIQNEGEQKKELSIVENGDTIFLDVNISYIYNNQMDVVGRIVVIHDITRIKTLEVSYRILSSELDQRVKERSEELFKSEERYRTLFNDSPIPLLEEDFSAVKKRVDELTSEGIEDFRTYFLNHSTAIRDFLGLVRIVDVNNAALHWYGVKNKDQLRTTLRDLILPEYSWHFMEELLSLLKNKTFFEVSVERLDRGGNRLFMIINGKISPGHEDTWSRVMVSILDITKLKQAETDLEIAYDTTLEGWARALELKDKETEGHSRRVTNATVALARAIGYTEHELVDIRRGTILHDIGKMATPDDILKKNGPLTLEERAIIQDHPKVAFDLLENIPHLKNALEIPYNHHEKWDGTGYPRGLKGEEIPLTARIFAVVDVWDALSHDRPYRRAWEQEKVLEYLKAESGKHFDPNVVSKFFELLNNNEI